jgi:dTDP-4-dehydrorhamnose 3,5-epimerase-like enzyme
VDIRWINLQDKSDARGNIVITESKKNIPFDIKRVYCLYNMNYEARGFHAHKELTQVMVCLAGSCDVLMDNGNSKTTIQISPNNQGLLIPPMVWHEMSNFSESCVLMVLASEWYIESDYIRNYDEFIQKTL